MSEFLASFPVDSYRHSAGGANYDVVIYQRGKEFHAAWYCHQCFVRVETDDCLDSGAAKRAAEADIGRHQLVVHRTPEPPPAGR